MKYSSMLTNYFCKCGLSNIIWKMPLRWNNNSIIYTIFIIYGFSLISVFSFTGICAQSRNNGIGLEQNLLSHNLSLKHIVVGYSGSRPESVYKNRTLRSPLNDVVSKNITLVLENLLKNYESSQLPNHGRGNVDSRTENVPKSFYYY